MDKRKNGNAILLVVVAIVVVGVVVLLFARNNAQTSYQNSNNPATTSQVTSGNSNADLQQDMNSLDTSLKGSTDAQTNVNQGLSDTPIPQPN